MRNLLLVALLLTACRTPATPASRGTDRAMLGSDDRPLAADWLAWTPSDAVSTPASLGDDTTAFDYWQVTDPAQLESAWAAVFGVLGEVRRVTPPEYDATLRMLMTVLEPSTADGALHLDATFFAARPGKSPMFEGVAWRIWREMPSGATPGVTVYLRRFEGTAEQPSQALVWFYGGFAEAKSLSLRLITNAATTQMALGDGIAASPTTPTPGEGTLVREILQQTFWQPFIGSAYLETPIERRDPTQPTPAQQPAALGLALGDRDIDQVFSDSVFAPRLTLFPARQKAADSD